MSTFLSINKHEDSIRYFFMVGSTLIARLAGTSVAAVNRQNNDWRTMKWLMWCLRHTEHSYRLSY